MINLDEDYKLFIKKRKEKRKIILLLLFLFFIHIFLFITSIKYKYLHDVMSHFMIYGFSIFSLFAIFYNGFNNYLKINKEKFSVYIEYFTLKIAIISIIAIKVFSYFYLKKSINFNFVVDILILGLSFFYFVILQEIFSKIFNNTFLNVFVVSFLFSLLSNSVYSNNRIFFYNYIIGVIISLVEYMLLGYIIKKTKDFYIAGILILI